MFASLRSPNICALQLSSLCYIENWVSSIHSSPDFKGKCRPRLDEDGMKLTRRQFTPVVWRPSEPICSNSSLPRLLLVISLLPAGDVEMLLGDDDEGSLVPLALESRLEGSMPIFVNDLWLKRCKAYPIRVLSYLNLSLVEVERHCVR
jgi:hypothetical protein